MHGRVLRPFDPWKSPLCTCPPKYSLHPYTGCSHRCLYCYATSYIGVRDSAPKRGFLEQLARDLSVADRGLTVEMSTSSDPYPPIEASLELTREALRTLFERGFKVLITTKSSLVVRDADLLSKGRSAVMITITTLDEDVSKRLEPGAPPPNERLSALRELARRGVPVGVRVDPVVPFINDDPHQLSSLVEKAYEAGAKHVVTSTYKAKPDSFRRLTAAFPEVASKLADAYFSMKTLASGYYYLPRALREKLLAPVVRTASKLSMSFATCREGLSSKDYYSAKSCDGSHLIPRD